MNETANLELGYANNIIVRNVASSANGKTWISNGWYNLKSLAMFAVE